MSSRDEVAQAGASEAFAEAVLRGCLEEFAHVRLTVTGGCMSPALKAGDTVLIAASRRYRPRFGDIVLVRLAAGLRLHRLVWGWPARGSFGRTKADLAAYWDPPFTGADLLGAVVGLERDGGVQPRPRRLLPALRSLAGAGRARLVRRR